MFTPKGNKQFACSPKCTIHYRSVKSDSGCLEWQGSCATNGYGEIRIDGKSKRAHRVAWESEGKKIPEGMILLHSCDNRRCVNVDHLRIGSHKENTQDMIAKGRDIRGSLCSWSKLSEEDVTYIKSAKAEKFHGLQKKLADKFGVSRSAISDIWCGRNWKK